MSEVPLYPYYAALRLRASALSHRISLSRSLSHTHTHILSLYLALSNTHPLLSPSPSYTHTHIDPLHSMWCRVGFAGQSGGQEVPEECGGHGPSAVSDHVDAILSSGFNTLRQMNLFHRMY